MNDIQKTIREELAKVQNSKFAKKTDKQLAVVDDREANGWKEKNEARFSDLEYTKKVGKKISDTYNTPEGKKKQATKSKPHTEEAKRKISKANIGLKKSDEIKEKLSIKKIGNTNRCKIIVTPIGTFPSKKLAAEAYLKNGKLNAMKWIDKWLKTDPNNFYYK